MRTLYFDLDGSLLVGDTGAPKAALAKGRFERAVRDCGFEALVCVGNFVNAGRAVQQIDPDYDIHGAIFTICGGIFQDEELFRTTTSLTTDSYYRAAGVNLDSDWWYLDDLAEYYFAAAGLQDVFNAYAGNRIFVPDANGDGEDVIEWIDRVMDSSADRP